MDRADKFARATERRRDLRLPAAHAVTIRDRRGRVLVRGRTADISERGLFCLVGAGRARLVRGDFLVELDLPAISGSLRTGATRRVRRAASLVRAENIGHLVGLHIALGKRCD